MVLLLARIMYEWQCEEATVKKTCTVRPTVLIALRVVLRKSDVVLEGPSTSWRRFCRQSNQVRVATPSMTPLAASKRPWLVLRRHLSHLLLATVLLAVSVEYEQDLDPSHGPDAVGVMLRWFLKLYPLQPSHLLLSNGGREVDHVDQDTKMKREC